VERRRRGAEDDAREEHLAAQIEAVQKLEADVSDTVELIGLAEGDGDTAMTEEGLATLRTLADEAKRRRSRACCPAKRT